MSNEPKVCPVAHDEQPKTCPVAHDNIRSSNMDEPPDTSDHFINQSHSIAKVIENSETNDPLEEIPGIKIPSTGRGNDISGQYWLNPSANQLERALKRKNKPIEHEDSISVSTVHAYVTEQTWNEIMRYESFHFNKCTKNNIKLAKFEGKDGIFSPKARIFNKLFNNPLPYDRHDWTVDRCGKEIQYVIDYYAIPYRIPSDNSINNSTSNDDNNDNNNDTQYSDKYDEFVNDPNIQFMYTIDARPKINSFGNIFDRIKMSYKKWKNGDQWY